MFSYINRLKDINLNYRKFYFRSVYGLFLISVANFVLFPTVEYWCQDNIVLVQDFFLCSAIETSSL
jgi:hypothetical protein